MTLTVTDTADTVAADGVLTLREALEAANTNMTVNEAIHDGSGGIDTIVFALASPGVITLTQGELRVHDFVTITGPGAAELTINGNSASRVFRIRNEFAVIDVTLTGLRLTGGEGLTGGGAISNSENLTIGALEIADNASSLANGGAIYNDGTLIVANCTLSGNQAVGGGAIHNVGTATLTNCTLASNTALGFAVLEQTVDGSGGAIHNSGALTLTNCTLARNRAVGVVDEGNQRAKGGGIANEGTMTLYNSIVADNRAHVDGGPDLHNSGTLTGSHNLIEAMVGAHGFTDTPISADPLLESLADNGGPTLTLALRWGSPALNAGDDSAVPADVTTDQRGPGFRRIVGAVDLGAFESQNPVVDTVNDEDDGNYRAGDLSLREAIALSNANPGAGTITFAAALSGSAITLTQGELLVSDSTTITGPGADALTISGNNASRVFRIFGRGPIDVTIKGLRLTGGLAPGKQPGGAILNEGERVTIADSVITGNLAEDGGGVANTFNGTLIINRCTVADNIARFSGGGILSTPFGTSFGTLEIVNSTIANNEARFGGGIYTTGELLTLVNSTVSGNEAGGVGGIGGGVYYFAGFTSNSATITNCTLANNSAVRFGGGIYVDVNSLLTLNNSIVADNGASGDFYSEGIITGGNNLIESVIGPGGLGGLTGTITIDPMLGPLADNGGPTQTHALLLGSPAIGGGDNSLVPAGDLFDQRGFGYFRRNGGVVDIGAIEYNPTSNLVVDTDADEDDGDYGPGDLSLREAVALANTFPSVDEITFASTLRGPISLTRQISIADSVTLAGPGAALLTVSGSNDGSQVFRINNDTALIEVAISGLTLEGFIENAGEAVSFANSAITRSPFIFGDGGIKNSGVLALTNCTVAHTNVGISNDSAGILEMINSTVSNYQNYGIFNDGTLALTNCTVAGNEVHAIVQIGIWLRDGVATLHNTIVADSSEGQDVVNDNGNPLTGANNLIESGTGLGGLFDTLMVDPMLGPLADNGGPTRTHALRPGSPAINAGENASVPDGVTTDQRGLPRVTGFAVDIGAFEATTAALDFVVDTANDENDGNYGPGGFSLREAIGLSNANPYDDTIRFAPALNGSTITLTLGQLVITDSVTIDGPGAAELTVSGNHATRIFDIDNPDFSAASVTITGMTLTSGDSSTSPFPTSGGAISINNGHDVTLIDVVVTESASGIGGAMVNHGSLTLRNCTVSNNQATFLGGGLYNFGSLAVINSTISGNSAGESGGAIANFSGTASTLTGSTLSGNRAGNDGGGIYNELGILSVIGCTLSGNEAGRGGGIYHAFTTVTYRDLLTVTVLNSTLSGNQAAQGGGIFLADDRATITNCTIARNGANPFGGGGIYVADGVTATLNNTIVADSIVGVAASVADDIAGDGLLLGSHNIIESPGAAHPGDTLVQDPVLGPLADNGGPTQTHSWLGFSPADDAGDDALVPAGITTDQRGGARFFGAVDIGAYERPPLHSVAIFSAIVSTSSGTLSEVSAVGNPSPEDAPDVEFPGGFIGFTLTGLPPGGRAEVIITFPVGLTPDTYYKYGPTPDNPSPHWYEFLRGGGELTGATLTGSNVVYLDFVDGQEGDSDGFANGIITDPGGPAVHRKPPTVQSVRINNGGAQRSKVNRITVTFSEIVALGAGAFELRRSNGTPIPLKIARSTQDGRTVATLAFKGRAIVGGSLPNGRYTLKIKSNRIHDRDGLALDGNLDGRPGGDAITRFFRLYGDLDGDGDVDRRDRANTGGRRLGIGKRGD